MTSLSTTAPASLAAWLLSAMVMAGPAFGQQPAPKPAPAQESQRVTDIPIIDPGAPDAETAKRLGVAHPTAVKNIARLKREGLATALPYRGIFLTGAGQELANRVRARHRLIVELLIAVGVPADAAEADAEGMEHHASKATLDAFATFLAQKK